MKNKFSKICTVGFIGLFSFSVISCSNGNEERDINLNSRNVNFDFTYSARENFDLNSLNLTQTKSLEIGTNLYDFVNEFDTSKLTSEDSIFQGYAWLIDGTDINPETTLEDDVTITLSAIRTHKEVLANVILSNPISGLDNGLLDRELFRRVVTPDTDVFSDANIENEILDVIFEQSYETEESFRQLDITFGNGLDQFNFASSDMFVIDVTIGNVVNTQTHGLMTINIDLIDEGDRFTSHLDIQTGGNFVLPMFALIPSPMGIATRHQILRNEILERANENNDDISFILDDFGISTGGTQPVNPNGLFYIDVTVPTVTGGEVQGFGSVNLSYDRNTYDIESDSAVVNLISDTTRIEVPRFLSDTRWNAISDEDESLYNVFIYNRLTKENTFQLSRNLSTISELEETYFTFEQLEANQVGALFVLNLEEATSTITIVDIENSGEIDNDTDGILLFEDDANGIGFPRAMQLDEEAIDEIVMDRLMVMLLTNDFVRGDFVINDAAHTTAYFNVIIANETVQIVNLTESFSIYDRTMFVDFHNMTHLEDAQGGNTNTIVFPRAIANEANLKTIVIQELDYRTTTEFMYFMDIMGIEAVFTFDEEAINSIFLLTLDITHNQIIVDDIFAAEFTSTISIQGIPGIVQTLNISDFQFNITNDDNLLEVLEELMIAISSNGQFRGHQFILNEGQSVVGFSPEIHVTADDALRSTNLMLYTNSPDLMPEFSGSIILRAIPQEDFTNLSFAPNETGYTVIPQNTSETISVNGHVYIPTFYNGRRVTQIAANAFSSFSNIRSVTLPLFIERIEARAFANAQFTTAIRLENLPLLYYIGADAFAHQNASQSRMVVLNNLPSLVSIGDRAFVSAGISSVELRNLPNLLRIGNRAFRDNPALTRIYLENLNTSLTWPEANQANNAFNIDGWVLRTITMSGSWNTQPDWWTIATDIFSAGPNPRFLNDNGQPFVF